MSTLDRLIDANANRAREAMRVMEDAARFILNDASLSRQLKQMRHGFADVMRRLGAHASVELHRDTPGDVGTTVTTDAERTRDSIYHVVAAAAKRLSEALRCCEEYGKLIDPALSQSVEQLRYLGYDMESRLLARMSAYRARQWGACVLITESLCTHHGWLDVARAAMDGGADAIQLREKSLDDTAWSGRAAQLVELVDKARRPGVAVIINDRPDIALAAGAHGVHLGQSDLPCEQARKLAGRRLVIGVSTSKLTEARAAASRGADYCGVGPMFPTTTKHKPRLAGPQYLHRFIDRHPDMPHLAIGGITPGNVDELVAVGCRGVAVSACVCSAKRPDTIVRKLVRALRA